MQRFKVEPEVDMILVPDKKNPARTLIFFHYKRRDELVHAGYVNTSGVKPFLSDVFKVWNEKHQLPETIES